MRVSFVSSRETDLQNLFLEVSDLPSAEVKVIGKPLRRGQRLIRAHNEHIVSPNFTPAYFFPDLPKRFAGQFSKELVRQCLGRSENDLPNMDLCQKLVLGQGNVM